MLTRARFSYINGNDGVSVGISGCMHANGAPTGASDPSLGEGSI